MNTDKLVKELRSSRDAFVAEREELSEKIAVIDETLRKLGAKRGPGRPKGSGKKAEAEAAPAPRAPARKKAKRNWSPEAKAAASARMKAYWADKRKKS